MTSPNKCFKQTLQKVEIEIAYRESDIYGCSSVRLDSPTVIVLLSCFLIHIMTFDTFICVYICIRGRTHLIFSLRRGKMNKSDIDFLKKFDEIKW